MIPFHSDITLAMRNHAEVCSAAELALKVNAPLEVLAIARDELRSAHQAVQHFLMAACN